VGANLARTADLCRADADFLDARAGQVSAHLRGLASVPIDDFAQLEDAILSRVLRDWVLSLGVPAQNLGAARVAELVRLIRSRSRVRLSLQGDTKIFIGSDRVMIQPAAKAGRLQAALGYDENEGQETARQPANEQTTQVTSPKLTCMS